MNWFDLGLWAIGAFVVFVVCGAGLLFVLAWASDKWDNRHTGGEDERLSSAAGGIIASPLGNAEVSGAGTASAGLPGYTAGNTE